MASEKLLDKLNDAIAREIQVSIQYIWQHVLATGIKGEIAKDIFKSAAITEMKHAEEIAERLNMLGGVPTTQPTPISVGKSFEEMVKNDIEAEEGAIAMYREIIKMANAEEDYTTAKMMINILADEEEHLDSFQGILED